MKIYYQNEYEDVIHVAYNKTEAPTVSDKVRINNEEYVVKSRIWIADSEPQIVIINIAEELGWRVPDRGPTKLSQEKQVDITRALEENSKQQDKLTKKNRELQRNISDMKRNFSKRLKEK